MAHSTNSEAVLRLGKRLIQELELEPGVDTLAKWMAHYISELIEETLTATPERAKSAQEKCFERILQLWRHLANHGRVRDQFETGNELINTLERLSNPERTYYFDSRTKRRIESLEQARQIDSAARAILRLLLLETVAGIGDREQQWIELAQHLPTDAQGKVARVIIEVREHLDETAEDVEDESEELQMIERARNGIAHFRSVLDAIEKGIDQAERKDTNKDT